MILQNDLEKAISLLKENQLTCVILGPETLYTSTQRGIVPLLTCYKEKLAEEGCCAADKVVGKAAAYVYVLLGIRALYAEVISRPALEVLESRSIEVHFGNLVDAIINRTGTGFCPMESAVMKISDPLEALSAVEQTLKKLQS